MTPTRKILISAVCLCLSACYSEKEVKQIASECEPERIEFIVDCLRNSNKGAMDCEYFSVSIIEDYGCGALMRNKEKP